MSYEDKLSATGRNYLNNIGIIIDRSIAVLEKDGLSSDEIESAIKAQVAEGLLCLDDDDFNKNLIAENANDQ